MLLYRFYIASLFALLMISCQGEETIINQPAPDSIAPNSELAVLLTRVSQSITSLDNVLDGSNCFSIQLPFTAVVNGQQMLINDESDYLSAAAILGASNADEDSVVITFPITITYADYTQQTLTSQQQLALAVASCAETFGEIDCIDFDFPIVFNTYDAQNQIAGSSTITNDIELYTFIQNLQISDIIGMIYPISLTDSDGQYITVNSNSELTAAIESTIGTCTPQPDGGGNADDTLPEIIVDGSWFVSYYYHNEDETSNYAAYSFVFSPSGGITASAGNNVISGSWFVHEENGQQMMEIDFDNSDLGDLEDDWLVLEFSATEVKLRQAGGGSDPDRLYFTKI